MWIERGGDREVTQFVRSLLLSYWQAITVSSSNLRSESIRPDCYLVPCLHQDGLNAPMVFPPSLGDRIYRHTHGERFIYACLQTSLTKTYARSLTSASQRTNTSEVRALLLFLDLSLSFSPFTYTRQIVIEARIKIQWKEGRKFIRPSHFAVHCTSPL